MKIKYAYFIFVIIKILKKMRACFLMNDQKQKTKNPNTQNTTNYHQYQSPQQQTVITNDPGLMSNLYPKLPDLNNEALMNKMTEQVVKNYTGWGE